MKPYVISVAQACTVCGVSKKKLHEMMKRGALDYEIEGKRRLVKVDSIERHFGEQSSD